MTLFTRLLLIILFAAMASGEAHAQRRQRPARKKPFASFSASAQRLKGSLTNRITATSFYDADSSAPTVFRDAISAEDTLIAVARSQLGTRYLLGGERPGEVLDCSALTRFVLSALRIDLPRTAREQATRGTQVARDPSQLKPGDLLTFGRKDVTHIGVYVGEGRFIHASTSKKQVVEASIATPGTWFRRNWIGVRRLLIASTSPADSIGEH